ncbi:hypothetical protein J4458_02485 [Candidatus Woesearchaeota archaeon]|nr:hypothetical protein [Candidatus Woesearchaeota archaeon]
MGFHKKGMSPLIATLLLISVAVSIGTTIMSFGSAFYEERRMLTGAELSCRYLELELNEINKIPQFCFDKASANVDFTVTNKANIDIESLVVWLVGNEVYVVNVTEPIAAGYPLRKKIVYDPNVYGALKQAQLIPKIKQEEGQAACSSKKLVIESIREC